MRLLYLLLLALTPTLSFAQWIGDSTRRKPISTIPQVSENSRFTVSDGQGGAIVIIETDDNRICAQRVAADGLIMWGGLSAPVVLCQGDSIREVTSVIADGNGGAIVAWRDGRFNESAYELFAQKVNANGEVLWTANGVRLTNTPAIDEDPVYLASNGAGGAIAAWGANDKVGQDYETFAQLLNASGVPQWTASGVLVINSQGFRTTAGVVSDGQGGAIIAMSDTRNDPNGRNYSQASNFTLLNLDIFAQRLSANGSRQWGNGGVGVFTAANEQFCYSNTILPDGQGGIVVFAEDYRNDVVVNGATTGENVDVYVQRLNSAGLLQWGSSGTVVTNAPGRQFIGFTDGQALVLSAGMFACTWLELTPSNENIYAQAFNTSGAAQWQTNGVMVINAGADKYLIDHAPVANSLGELVVVYEIETNFSPLQLAIRVQKLSPSGQLQFTTNGKAVNTVIRNYSSALEAVASLDGSVIGVWDDEVSNDDLSTNIFGAGINADGSLATAPAGGPFITADAGLWHNAAIWQGGAVPTPGSTVIIRHQVQAAANASVKSLTLEQGKGVVQVGAGVQLQVTGN